MSLVAGHVDRLRDGLGGDACVQEKAVRALANLSALRSNRTDIVKAGGTALLVASLDNGTSDAKTYAMVALGRIATSSVSNQERGGERDFSRELIAAGGISTLVELARSGTDWDKKQSLIIFCHLTSRLLGRWALREDTSLREAIVAAGGIPVIAELALAGSDEIEPYATCMLDRLSKLNTCAKDQVAALREYN